jgi:hypothetical protein
MSDINETLDEREQRYGSFQEFANIEQRLKEPMQLSKAWGNLKPSQRSALEMIQHKIARILNGDPNYADNWHDIAGYATLVERTLTDPKP